MKKLNIFIMLVVIFFLSPSYYDFDGNFTSNSCFSDESALRIFEPIPVTETLELLYAHGGGINKCGCHFNRKINECHCHQNKGCGCECQPSSCS